MIRNKKTTVIFSNSLRGQKAEARYNDLMNQGWPKAEAIQHLRMQGYTNEIKTNLYA